MKRNILIKIMFLAFIFEMAGQSYRINMLHHSLDWSKIFYQWLMANRESIKFDYDGEKDWSFWK